MDRADIRCIENLLAANEKTILQRFNVISFMFFSPFYNNISRARKHALWSRRLRLAGLLLLTPLLLGFWRLGRLGALQVEIQPLLDDAVPKMFHLSQTGLDFLQALLGLLNHRIDGFGD